MATTQEYLLGSATTLLSTELNSLASSSTLAAGAISSVGGTSGKFDNTAGGGGLGGYTLGQFEINCAAPSGAVTAGSGVFVWLLTTVDGTNYENGSASIVPVRRPDVIIPFRAVTSTAQRIIVVAPLPPGTWFVLLSQNSGQAFAASSNTLKVTPVTNQMV
jgi:hypothetical protein